VKRHPEYIHYKQPWIPVLLRALGLSLVWNIATKLLRHPRKEVPKQAMRQGRLVVALALSVHVIPMGTAIALIWLNVHGYYIGGELAGPSGWDDLKLSGLQFASKLHELLMQASLSVVVVSFIRHELVVGEGIPFGAIFGSLQFSSIAYIWSKEFAGTLKARFRTQMMKWRLVLLIVLGTGLAVTVGPSSAISMRPRLDAWPAGGTDFYINATTDQIWPTSLNDSGIPTECSNVTLGMNCISDSWTTLSDGLIPFWPNLNLGNTIPEFFGVVSPKSMRQLYTKQTTGIYWTRWTLATTQMSNLGDAVAEIGRLWINAAYSTSEIVNWKYSTRFRYRKEATYTIDDIYQPLTMATCLSSRSSTQQDTDADSIKAYMPIMETTCTDTIQSKRFNSSGLVANFRQDVPILQFVDVPVNEFGRSTVGALITFPETWPGGRNTVTCGVDSRWVPSQVSSSRSSVKVVSGLPTGFELKGTCFFEGSKNITVSSQWANYLNPNLVESNLTVFHHLLESIPGTYDDRWEDDAGFVQPLIESILSVLVTNGLAHTAASATPQGILKGCTADKCDESCSDGDGAWCREILPNGEFGSGGNIYNLPPGADTTKMTKFTTSIQVTGYAYNLRGTSLRLSCVVLFIYVLVALIHIGFSFWTGLSSQSWDTVSEVTALAMQSQPSRHLKNTCAGIDTTSIFTHMVKIVQTGEHGEHLELDFGDSTAALKQPLVPNEFYE